MATITLSNIAHSYHPEIADHEYALKKLNMVWKDGGTYALLGPSGCGKSTMLNIISGIIYPSEGTVFFNDVNVTRQMTKNRNIAQVFQFPVIYNRMTVGENLAFPLVCRRVPRDERIRRVKKVATLLNLTDKLSYPARHLAADEKQLISLGRGLVRNDVSALLLDEPLTVIDPQLKFEIRRKLKDINQSYKLTTVLVTHDQNEAMSFADTVVVMKDGQVIQAGTPEELYERPNTTFVGYFIGSPAMNFVPGFITGRSIETAGGSLLVPPNVNLPGDVKKIQIGLRPRYASWHAMPGKNTLKGRIVDVLELGPSQVVSVLIGEEKIRIKTKFSVSQAVPRCGDMGFVSFPPDKICLYFNGNLIV